MKVEAGEEGERSVDQVLAQQSSYQGRGRSIGAAAAYKRGISKEPTPVAAAAATGD